MSILKPTYKKEFKKEEVETLYRIYHNFCEKFLTTNGRHQKIVDGVINTYLNDSTSRLIGFFRSIDTINNRELLQKALNKGGEFTLPNTAYFAERFYEVKVLKQNNDPSYSYNFKRLTCDLYNAAEESANSVREKLPHSSEKKAAGDMSAQ